MFKRCLMWCPVGLALFLIISATCSATTVERLTLEDLSKRAASILYGQVQGSRTFWSGRLILTTYTIEVHEALKGPAFRRLEITTVGGKVGNAVLHVAGMPAFKNGESAILFVERAGVYSTVLGLGQGKFTVSDGNVTNKVSDLSFSDGKRPSEIRMPLEAFKKQIREAMDRP